MMKRILLIVALGVSFVAPAAFANVARPTSNLPYADFKTCPPTTGSFSNCQTDQAIAKNATLCEKDIKLKQMISDNIAAGYNGDGSKKTSGQGASGALVN